MRDITKKELSDAKLYQEEVEYNDGEIDEYYEDCYHEDRDFSVYKPENRWDDYDRGYPDDYDRGYPDDYDRGYPDDYDPDK
jgi:hypothetical protein